MTDYSKRSDGEINMAVAKLMGTYRYVPENLPCDRHLGRNYCNSWADAGPIAEKNRIGTIPSSGGTHMAWATSVGMLGDKQAHSEKLCRAICIVFLMMNEGE